MFKLSRFQVVLLFMFLLYLVIVFRLVQLQIVKGSYYREISENNYVRLFTVNPPRGKIFDRNGVLLAYDVPTFTLSALPYIVKKRENLEQLEKNLKDYLGIELSPKVKESFKKGLITKVIVYENLTDKQLKRFFNNSYLFKGFYVEVVPKRKYTKYAKYMPHVLGYVGYPSKKDLREKPYLKPDMIVGKSGIEKTFDQYLKGEPGAVAVVVDALGRQKKVLWEKQAKRGNDIYLTIDARLQKIAYDSFVESGQKSGAVVVVNPQNYEILALLSYPIFDIQKFTDGLSAKEWKKILKNKYKPLFNKALNGLYPPGSIFKIIVGAGALQEKIITPYTKIESGASFSIGKWTYRNWNPAGCGKITVAQALEMSCDTFFYQVGLQLGVDRINYYTYKFGIGEILNDEIEKKRARVPSPDWKMQRLNEVWFYGDTINLSIGQGYLAITPFDATKIVVPIANGGKVYKPKILKAYFSNKDQRLYKMPDIFLRDVDVNRHFINVIKKGMYLVVYGNRGTAKRLADAPVKNAGKTGTAQVYRYLKRKQKHDKWELKDHAWFVDFYPYKKPKYAVSVFVEHGESGGRVAAPIVKSIIEKSINENVFTPGS